MFIKNQKNKKFMTTEIKQIMEKLDHIQTDIIYLKKHIIDLDLVLTDDDLEALSTAEKDFKLKRTLRIA